MITLKKHYHLGKYMPGLMTIGDWLCLNIAVWISWAANEFSDIFLLFWGCSNLAFMCTLQKSYRLHQIRPITTERLITRLIGISAQTIIVLLAILYVVDDCVSFSLIVVFVIEYLLLLIISTIVVQKTLWIKRSQGYNFRNAIVIGAGNTSKDLVSQITQNPGFGINIVAVVDDGEGDCNEDILKSCNVLHPLDKISEIFNQETIDIIYYASDRTRSDSLSKMMQLAEEKGMALTYITKLPKYVSAQFEATQVASMPAFTHTLSPLFGMKNRIIKRIFDICFSSVFLIFSPLIFVPIAIGIKLSSPGPVFFKQKRTGLYGSDFLCYKFRTMRVNAESNSRQATKNDPRKTKFGNFLRKTSLDELPQFINVFMGSMSVVGPRPHMTSQTEEYSRLIDKYMIRHGVKPGITGLAQVRGFRGATEELWQMERRVENDVEYISNWSLILDIKIILLTVFNQLRGEDNAY